MLAETSPQPPLVEVAAAVLRDAQGRLLLSQRPEGKHLAGLWEFPGGKRESGESIHDALARELREELGIEVAESKPLLSLTHHYPEKSVRLLIRTVDQFLGTARGCEGQRVGWFDLAAARSLPMPAADRPILNLLSLDPRLLIVSGHTSASLEPIVNEWQRCLDAGFRLLLLRPQGLNETEFEDLAKQCGHRAQKAGARWLLEGRPGQVQALGADGVHLSPDDYTQYKERPIAADQILAVSCRDQEDLQRAACADADIAYLMPKKFGSADLVGSEPDWRGFEKCVIASPIPLLVCVDSPDDLSRARELGAFGVVLAHKPTRREAEAR